VLPPSSVDGLLGRCRTTGELPFVEQLLGAEKAQRSVTPAREPLPKSAGLGLDPERLQYVTPRAARNPYGRKARERVRLKVAVCESPPELDVGSDAWRGGGVMSGRSGGVGPHPRRRDAPLGPSCRGP
jgi:hypothetical protein